jgi:hypothetical protein
MSYTIFMAIAPSLLLGKITISQHQTSFEEVGWIKKLWHACTFNVWQNTYVQNPTKKIITHPRGLISK